MRLEGKQRVGRFIAESGTAARAEKRPLNITPDIFVTQLAFRVCLVAGWAGKNLCRVFFHMRFPEPPKQAERLAGERLALVPVLLSAQQAKI